MSKARLPLICHPSAEHSRLCRVKVEVVHAADLTVQRALSIRFGCPSGSKDSRIRARVPSMGSGTLADQGIEHEARKGGMARSRPAPIPRSPFPMPQAGSAAYDPDRRIVGPPHLPRRSTGPVVPQPYAADKSVRVTGSSDFLACAPRATVGTIYFRAPGPAPPPVAPGAPPVAPPVVPVRPGAVPLGGFVLPVPVALPGAFPVPGAFPWPAGICCVPVVFC